METKHLFSDIYIVLSIFLNFEHVQISKSQKSKEREKLFSFIVSHVK